MTTGPAPRMGALIVEDDRGMSELGAAMLREFDLDVAQVTSAEAALDHLVGHPDRIGVVVIDIQLLGPMNGMDLAHRISVLWPTISLIVTSGHFASHELALPARAVFIPKPWRPLDIVAAAERAARADHSVQGVRL